jgi:hypothetical protein
MAMWWTRVLRDHFGAPGERVSAELIGLAAVTEFLRPPLSDYQLPDQAAEAKARVLLERALTQQQRRDLFAKRCFYVKGRKFNYRVREGRSGNVDVLDVSGRVISRLCAHPLGRVPIYDMMLAQKLWIETDENMFLESAAPYPLQ